MKRQWVLALAVFAAIPRLASAQSEVFIPKLRVSPYIGISPGISQSGDATLFGATGLSTHVYRLDSSSSVPLGVNVDYNIWNSFSVVGGAVWSRRSSGELLDFEDELVYNVGAETFWMAKLGLGMRLTESRTELQLRHLGASIFIAPAIIHNSPSSSLGTPLASRSGINQWGLNLGADSELPLANSRFAFNLGLENWIMFWDKTKYAARVGGYLQGANPNIDAIALDTKNTNLWILHTGLSFRF